MEKVYVVIAASVAMDYWSSIDLCEVYTNKIDAEKRVKELEKDHDNYHDLFLKEREVI